MRPLIEDAVALHAMLEQQFGVDKAEIYTVFHDDGISLMVRTLGRQANLNVGAFEGPTELLQEEWTQACRWWNGLSQPERNSFYSASRMLNERQLEVALALSTAGLTQVLTTRTRLRQEQLH